LPRYGDILTFQDGGHRYHGFLNFLTFLTVRRLKKSRTASLCQILSTSVKPRLRYGDFSIFQDGGRPPSWICYVWVWTTHEGIWWSLSLCKIWLESMQYIFDDMHVFRYREFGLKTPIHAPKLGVWEILSPNWGAISTKPKKGTSLRESASFEPSASRTLEIPLLTDRRRELF